MQALAPYHELNSNIALTAELIIRDSETVELFFNWTDEDKKIIFAHAPENGRFMNLWQQTCFEAFLQPVGGKKYFEINLTANKAWNVFHFDDYRSPQPPTEWPGAKLEACHVEYSGLHAIIKIKDAGLQNVKASLCAVINLKDAGTSYWSVKHADTKPNFHHFESFITERTTT